MKFWVGTTDPDWFDFLCTRQFEEVNFWQPSDRVPFRTEDVGLPFLFKLKKPFDQLRTIGCQVIQSPVFLRRDQWLARPPGWSPNIVRGKMYDTRSEDGRAIWDAVGPHLQMPRTLFVAELGVVAPQLNFADGPSFGPEVPMRPGVTPDARIRVSPSIRDTWFNGKMYYRLDNQPLAVIPDNPAHRPAPALLDWHMRHVFRA